MGLIVAYVDPGTGATLMQLVLAGTVGVGAIIKLKWHSIRSFLSRSDVDEDPSSNAQLSEAASENEGPAR